MFKTESTKCLKYVISPLVLSTLSLFGVPVNCLAENSTFKHPGLLITEKNFEDGKARLKANVPDAVISYNKLLQSPFAQLSYKPHAVPIVYRGAGSNENYGKLYGDAAAAYQLALRWKLSNDSRYADASIAILNAWSSTLKGIDGSSDKYLAAGLYGYQLANAAEIMRAYPKWTKFVEFKDMLVRVFYPLNHDFLENHVVHGKADVHYWAGWDLCTLASMISIGILADDQTIYNEALSYINGNYGNGSLRKAIWYVFDKQQLAQLQESGRDQGHTTLSIALLGVIAQTAWNQGHDLYGTNDNLILKGAEYVAKYNLGQDVPWQNYTYENRITQTSPSAIGRGTLRPIWTVLYHHYAIDKNIKAPYIKQMMDKVGPEGGAGNYGYNSGGFDQLGYNTIFFNN